MPAGTSPPIRGIQLEERGQITLSRNIPAHTGNSFAVGHDDPLTTEHPRPYGEFTVGESTRQFVPGTSPPIRGIRIFAGVRRNHERNIPAHTGNSPCCPATSVGGPEHPRPYGEFSRGEAGNLTIGGTSPPIRGIRRRWGRGHALHRNIPAHTGNSAWCAVEFAQYAEHPRPYGEFITYRTAAELHGGTSPPIRGIRREGNRSRKLQRNIPAHTGNSPSGDGQEPRAAEHPRPYGEFRPA